MLKKTLYSVQFFSFLILALTGTIVLSSDETRYGPVSSNEDFWDIAVQVKPDDSLTTMQVAVSIFRRNIQAFRLKNLNGLMHGQILIIPSAAEMHSISSQTAEKMFLQHWEDWKNNLIQTELPSPIQASSLKANPPAADLQDNTPDISSTEKIRPSESVKSLPSPQSQEKDSDFKHDKKSAPAQSSKITTASKRSEKLPVAETMEKSPVLIPARNSSVFHSDKEIPVPETDKQVSVLPHKNITTQISEPVKKSILSDPASDRVIVKQQIKTEEIQKNTPDLTLLPETGIVYFFTQWQTQIKTYLQSNIKINNYLLYAAGFIAIVSILLVIFRREQTYPMVKLLDQPDADPIEKVESIIVDTDSNIDKTDSATTDDDIAKENDPFYHSDELHARLEKQQADRFEEQNSVTERNILYDVTEAELLSAVTSVKDNTSQHLNNEFSSQRQNKNSSRGLSDINQLTEAELLSVANSIKDNSSQHLNTEFTSQNQVNNSNLKDKKSVKS